MYKTFLSGYCLLYFTNVPQRHHLNDTNHSAHNTFRQNWTFVLFLFTAPYSPNLIILMFPSQSWIFSEGFASTLESCFCFLQEYTFQLTTTSEVQVFCLCSHDNATLPFILHFQRLKSCLNLPPNLYNISSFQGGFSFQIDDQSSVLAYNSSKDPNLVHISVQAVSCSHFPPKLHSRLYFCQKCKFLLHACLHYTCILAICRVLQRNYLPLRTFDDFPNNHII